MGQRNAPNLNRFLPHVVLATAAVIVLPIVLVSLLSGFSVLGSVFVSAPIAMVASLAASGAASAWWKKRPDAHDLVFADLMIWGWVRRLRTERRLSRAVELITADSVVPLEQQVACLEQLASALEARDPYTHGHTRRVTAHAVAIAETMGLSREQVAKVRTAAAIHDIGKLHTPREVLNKPGRLTDEEFEVIKRHPVDGAVMAAVLGDDEINAMVRHHHERLDGTGYPDRLSGEEIPLGARIIAVADTFDAITSKRPYRGAASHKKGMTILAKEAGTQLDPDAVHAFSSHYSGRRGVAVGSLAASAPGRLLVGQWGFGSAASITKGVAALAVAGTLGGSAAVLAKPSSGRGAHRVALAGRTTSVERGRSGSSVSASAHVAARSTAGTTPHHAAPSPHVSRPGASAGGPTRAARTHPGGSAGTGGSGGTRGPSSGAGGGSTSPGSSVGGTQSSGGGSGGGGSSSHGGGGSGSVTAPSHTVTTPPVTVSPPPVTVTTPVGTVHTPPVTVTTPPVTVTTPKVTVTLPSSPIGTPKLP